MKTLPVFKKSKTLKAIEVGAHSQLPNILIHIIKFICITLKITLKIECFELGYANPVSRRRFGDLSDAP